MNTNDNSNPPQPKLANKIQVTAYEMLSNINLEICKVLSNTADPTISERLVIHTGQKEAFLFKYIANEYCTSMYESTIKNPRYKYYYSGYPVYIHTNKHTLLKIIEKENH